VFGKWNGFDASLDLSTLDGNNGFVINGVQAGDESGWRVSSGDINGDGYSDLILGADRADSHGAGGAGESYVVYGQASGFGAAFELSTLDGRNGFVIHGVDALDYSGYSVSTAGDMNGDGFDDILIGASGADPHGSASGESYVVFGGAAGPGNIVITSDGLGTTDVESFVGSAGADSFSNVGADDSVSAGASDDTISIASSDFFTIDGGNGEDTLSISNDLDLTGMAGKHIHEIEIINLGSSGATLTVDSLSIANLSATSNTLRVDGSDGAVDFSTQALVKGPDAVIGGVTYNVYTQGAMTLQVEAGLTLPLAPAPTFDSLALSSLDGGNGFVINGIGSSDGSGWAVSSAGDVNGDGFDDIIVGAYMATFENLAGESYVVYGSSSGFSPTLELSALDGTAGFMIKGTAMFDQSGYSVSSAGDLNGDGFSDLIIGAHNSNPALSSSKGKSYVVFGQSASFGATLELSTLDGATGFVLNGINYEDYSGRAVSAAGDVNGDGFDDIIVGAHGASSPGAVSSGESYIVFGKSTGFSSAFDLSTLDGTTGFVIHGDSMAGSGWAVSSAGDVNSDGFDDIIIGGRGVPEFSPEPGAAYVVFGKGTGFSTTLDLSTLDGTTGFAINGASLWDAMGYSVSSAGDVNGDGFGDVIVGAFGAATDGESYVVFGKDSGFNAAVDISTLDGVIGFTIHGAGYDGNSGQSVSSAGDVNGDGFDDLIIGAPLEGAGGQSYVVFGEECWF